MNFSQTYLGIAQTKYKGLNLTGILTQEEFHCKQYLDSIAPLQGSPFFQRTLLEAETVIDVGFGGGFPLLPLAYHVPEKIFWGIDARRKKVEAVADIARKMGIVNVRPLHLRLEQLYLDGDAVLLFKAVGAIKDCLRLIRAGGRTTCFFYKGPGFSMDDEWEGFGELRCRDVLNVPGTHKRLIVGLTVNLEGKPDKKLVKMSELP